LLSHFCFIRPTACFGIGIGLIFVVRGAPVLRMKGAIASDCDVM